MVAREYSKKLISQLASVIGAEQLVFNHQHQAVGRVEIENDDITVSVAPL